MSTETIEHRPVPLTGFAGLCATGDCNHDTDMGPDGCQERELRACEACTFTGVHPDADFVRVVEWPCEHAHAAVSSAVPGEPTEGGARDA